MVTRHWNNSAGGDFDAGANWTPAGAPGSADDALIDQSGSYTVNSGTTNAVNRLALISTATLAISGASSFAILTGTGAGGLAGTLRLDDGALLQLSGNIVNSGAITETPAAAVEILFTGPATTLTGGGHIALSNNLSNVVHANGTADVLVNVDNTISGAGDFGFGTMTLLNQKAGVIDAAGSAGLLLDAATITNAGTLESHTNGGLAIENPVNNAGGRIIAIGSGAVVDLTTAIRGGTLATSGGGVIEADSGATLDGGSTHAITNTGLIQVPDLAKLIVTGTIANSGTIKLQDAGGTTDLFLNGPTVVLNGAGTILLSDSLNNRILSDNPFNRLVNNGNTITGAGKLGAGEMTVENHGVINADAGANAMAIDTGGNIAINTGTMKATNTGRLFLQSPVDNAGGTMLAAGASALVVINSVVEGGTLATSAGGTIIAQGGTLDGATDGVLTNQGTFTLRSGNSLTLLGAINNTGTINVQSTTTINLASQTVTLQGHGLLALADALDILVQGNSSSFRLVNQDNTISGAGRLGNAKMALENHGVVNASGATNGLLLDTGGNIAINTGTMEATGSGRLFLQSPLDNAGGTLLAAGSSALVVINSVVEGGTLATSAGGTIIAQGGTLDGATDRALTNQGTFSLRSGNAVTLLGTINNAGAINVQAVTTINVASQTVTLQGHGSLVMADATSGLIRGSNKFFRLLNVDNTISGAGTIGGAQMRLANGGSIVATGANPLIVDPGAGADVVNNAPGAMIGQGAGGMSLVNGAFTNNGTFAALNGSSLAMSSGASLSNNADGVLFRGTYKATSAGGGATLSLAGGAIAEDDATIILTGAGSSLVAGGSSLESSLMTIGAGHTLEVLGNRGYSSALKLVDNGLLQLSQGIFSTAGLTVASGARVLGGATIVPAVANAGLIEANGGVLRMTGKVSGAGTLQADSGSSLVLNGASNTAGSVLNNGTVTIGASDTLKVTGSVNPASTGLFVLTNASVLETAADTGAGNRISFLGASGDKLVIDAVGQFGTNVGLATYAGPKLLNFGTLDKVDLKNLAFSSATIDSYTAASGLLQLHSGATKATLLFDNPTLGSGSFHLAADGAAGSVLTRS